MESGSSTPDGWPMRLSSGMAARFLREVHGLPIEEKTLRNLRADGRGRGPAHRYFGVKPLYDRAELDRWATEDALNSEPPRRRNARLRAASLPRDRDQ